ncbi:MAG: HEAT repeat domain-containing protein [Planctomycetota bacterium]
MLRALAATAFLIFLVSGSIAEPPPHEAGIAVLASSIGKDQSVADIRAFVAEGHFRHVVVDWAWITAHWDRTDFAKVDDLVKALKADGVEVAAMYRPRFFAHEAEEIGVETQADADGKPADESHREICFSSEKARAWGVKWAADILRRCPSLEEVTVYNPRNWCACAGCAAAKAKDADAANAGTRRFLQEVKAAMTQVKKDSRLAVVYPPDSAWFAAMKEVVDVARPYVFLREDADFREDIASATKVRAEARAGGPALAKITWGATDRMPDAKLSEFLKLAKDAKLPFVFWTYDTAFLEGLYDLDMLAGALGADPARFKALVKKLGGTVAGEKPAPADPKEIKDAVDLALEKRDAEAGAAWKAIAEKFGEAAIAEVVLALEDTSHDLQQRFMAAWCLGAIGSPKCVPALLAASRDDVWAVRLYTAEGLGKTGHGNKAVEARLREMSEKDGYTAPDPRTGKNAFPVREAAAAALLVLASPPPAKPLPQAENSIDRLPWAKSLEEAISTAAKSGRMIVAFVLPYENGHFEDGYDGADDVRKANPPGPNQTEEFVRSFETGFTKERAILTALLGDPRNASLAGRRFVLLRLRLCTEHFPSRGTSRMVDPLQKLGTRCADSVPPAVLWTTPDGKLVHAVTHMGVFSPARFHQACMAVLAVNPKQAPLDDAVGAARDAARKQPADSTLRRKLVEELLACGAFREAKAELDAVSQANDDWHGLARGEIAMLTGDLDAAEKLLRAMRTPESLRVSRAALLADLLTRQRRFDEARKALDPGFPAPDGDPGRDRAEYVKGLLQDAAGKRAEAEDAWRGIVERAPAGPWAALAALRYSRSGPFLEEWATTEPVAADPLARGTERKRSLEDAIDAGVDYLLAQQRPDGSWRNPKLGDSPADGTGSQFDYAPARSALAVCALRAALPRLDAARAAKAKEGAARGIQFVREWEDRPGDWIWQVTYVLHLETRLLAESKGAEKETAAKRVKKLLESVARMESGGAWSYMPAPRLHTFNTAPILLSLAELKALGVAVDPKMMERAGAWLEKCRLGKKAVFHYGTRMEQLTSDSQPEGSAMRSPLIELALTKAGFEKTAGRVRESIDLFFKHLEEVRGTSKVWESHFDASVVHDAYHYYFGCWYAARTIRLLPANDQRGLAAKLVEQVLPTQEIDGGFVDGQMQGKSVGTALALLTLIEAAESKK